MKEKDKIKKAIKNLKNWFESLSDGDEVEEGDIQAGIKICNLLEKEIFGKKKSLKLEEKSET